MAVKQRALEVKETRRSVMALVEIFALLFFSAGSLAQHVRVEHSVSGFVGSQLALRCQFVDPGKTVTVTQVAWVKDPAGTKINLAVHNPDLGTTYPSVPEIGDRFRFRAPSLTDATLIIDPLQMRDDGIYSCEFATFPEGNQEGTTNLTILARPTNTGTALLVRAGAAEVAVASCRSSGGKPPSVISWRGAVMHNTSSETVLESDGTSTVTGKFLAVPTGHMDGEEVECIVTQQTLEMPLAIPIALSIQYPPIVTIEGYDGDWFLNREHASITCNVKANPTADTYNWKMNGGEMPSSIRVVGHQLTVDSVSYKVNGTFTCEASNSLGTSSGSVDIVVREHKLSESSNAGAIAGGVIGGILALLLVVCLVGFILHRRRAAGQASGSYSPKTRVFGARNGDPGPRPDFTYRPDSDSERGPSLAPTTTVTNTYNNTVATPLRGAEEDSPDSPPPLPWRDEGMMDEEGGMFLAEKPTDMPAEDDMESQRDGSIISKKPVYV